MKKSTQRLIAVFIAALMLFSVIPMSAFAVDETTEKQIFNTDGTLNAKDGDLLLSMTDLNVGSEKTDYKGITLSQITPQNSTSGEQKDGVYGKPAAAQEGGAAWTMYGVKTNLPLDTSSKYTIEYYAKIYTQINIALTYAFKENGKAQGLYTYPNSISACHGYKTQSYGTVLQTSFPNVWTGYKDADGYTRFTVEIDGTKATMYVAGNEAATYDFTELSTNGIKDNVTSGYVSDTLSLAVKGYADVAHTGELLMQVKNVSVYAGNTMKEEEKPIVDGDVLLVLNSLNVNDVANRASGVKVTQITPQNSRAPKDGELKDGVYSTGNGEAWTQYGVKTNLPLNTTSKYTVDYEVKLSDSCYADSSVKNAALIGGGMAFSFTANNNGQSIYPLVLGNAVNATYGYTQKAYYYSYKNNKTTMFAGAWTDYKDADGYTHFTLEVNGVIATLYVSGIEIASFDFTKVSDDGAKASPAAKNSFVSDVLTLVFKVRMSTAVKDTAACQVKNIKVTAGLKRDAEPTWNDGDLLLKMNTLNSKAEGNVTANPYNIPLYQIISQNCTEGALADGVYTSGINNSDAWTMYGVKTGLPLNETSQYTIEFYAKIPSAINIALTHSFNHNNNAQGLYIYPNSVSTLSGYNTQTYGTVKQTTFKNIWTQYQMTDGFTRFTVEIDGTKASMYVGGLYAATYDFTEVTSAGKADAGYISNCLSLIAKGHSDKTSDGDLLMQIKNISVYAGHHATDKTIAFVGLDGNVISSNLYKSGEIITKFPEITPAEGKQIVWFYEGSKFSIVELAPVKVVADMTLRAYELDINGTALAGVQFGAVAENKTKIRFVGTTINLQGSEVGFEIAAKYMNGETEMTSTWTRITSAVFTSVNAVKDGTIESVTAKELGGIYLFALDLTNVPTDAGAITFTVKTFKNVNGEKVYGETSEFVLTFNGTTAVISPVQA